GAGADAERDEQREPVAARDEEGGDADRIDRHERRPDPEAVAAILSGEAGRDGEAEEPEGHEQPGTADEPAEQGGLVPAVIGIAVVEREVDGVEAVRDLAQEETHGARR